jgi:hypothetical protein
VPAARLARRAGEAAMMQDIHFDHRFSWQGSSPSEHDSQAELCFKAKRGLDTVICRVPHRVLLNVLHRHAIRNDILDLDDETGDGTQRELCERLFHEYKSAIRATAQEKILAGRFALSFGHVRSILLGEHELRQKVLEASRAH